MQQQMSVKDWLSTLLLLMIPIVNIVLLFIWGFSRENIRKNYARAMLIVFGIVITLSVLFALMGNLIYISHASNEENSYEVVNDIYELREEESERLNNDIEILEVGLEATDTGKELVGILINNSTTETYSGFKINCTVYDQNGIMLHSKEVIISDSIPPGVTFKFSQFGVHDDGVTVEIVNVADDPFAY